MRAFLAVLLVFVLAAFALADNVPFTFCEPPAVPQPFVIDSIDMNPAIPSPGTNVEITITGSSTNGTTGGTVISEVSKAGIKLFTFTYDLCQSVVGGCPVPPGQSKIVIHQATPRFAFPGEYEAVNTAFDAEKKPISCAKFKIQIK